MTVVAEGQGDLQCSRRAKSAGVVRDESKRNVLCHMQWPGRVALTTISRVEYVRMLVII